MKPRNIFAAFLLLLAVGSPAFAQTRVEAFLYNAPTDHVVLHYNYNKPDETLTVKSYLNLVGQDAPEGSAELTYSIQGASGSLRKGSLAITTDHGAFNTSVKLAKPIPEARAVEWTLKAAAGSSVSGRYELRWSRLHGRVTYRDGKMRSTYIELRPYNWSLPGETLIPVAEDGSFDAMTPARVYRVVNVNGAGYSHDSLERWAWSYDLTSDREENFVIGRMELYGMRAFDLTGGPNMFYVIFRPTSLSRVLQFDANGDGVIDDNERAALVEGLKKSPTAIGPELQASDIKLWMDGAPLQVLSLTAMPEQDGDGVQQINYIAQCARPSHWEPKFGMRSHIKLEVISHEKLHGAMVEDFGQGSVDIQWPM